MRLTNPCTRDEVFGGIAVGEKITYHRRLVEYRKREQS